MSEIDGKKSFLSKLIFLKLFYWTSRLLFWQNNRRTALSFLFTLRKCYIIFLQRIIILLKMLFCKRKLQVWRTRRKISKKSRICLSNVQKWRFFFKKMICIKKILWTSRLQFRQPRWILLTKAPAIFRSSWKLEKKVCFSEEKWVSSKISAGDVECSFEYPAEKLLTKEQNIFAPYLYS